MTTSSETSAKDSSGLPTPPYSETASSAGGSIGRAQQRPGESTPQRPSRRSLLHAEQSAASRSPSVSSSRTGSETIGATSPLVNQDNFVAHRHGAMQSPARRDRARLEDAPSPTHSSPSSERTRRSELHERDVTQLRTESRLGSRIDDDDAGDRSRDSLLHKYSPRKSTTLNKSSNYRAGDDSQDSLPSRRRQTQDPSDASSVLGDRRYTPDVSGSSRRLAKSGNAQDSGHAPMPAEFRLPDKEVRRAYRAAQAGESSDSDDNGENSSPQVSGNAATSLKSSPSDATRLTQTAGADSASRFQKASTNSASDLHRAASRASMQRAQTRDPFTADEGLSLPPRRSLSPSERTERSFATTSSGKARLFADKSPYTPDRALEGLRLQIEDMHISGRSSNHGGSSSNDTRLSSGARSSMGLRKSAVGRGLNGLTPVAPDRMQRLPLTEPARSRMVHNWTTPNSGPSSDTVNRINDLVSLRSDNDTGRSLPLRSSTSMGIAADRIPNSPLTLGSDSSKEPAPIKNMSVRFAQLESLYGKVPTADGSFSGAGAQTSRVVELMGAIVKGTASMWSELARMHPIATEGHLMGTNGDVATSAFGQLDEGFAFVSKLTLEQARAVQDLLFLLDRMEKERQSQFNQVLQELGHSPRPFSRVGGGERAPSSLSRASSTLRGMPQRFAEDSTTGSPFARGDRGATLTASQLRSMTSLGHASNHMRSASELSPSSSAALRRIHRVRPSEDATSTVSSILPPRSARESNFFTPPSAQASDLTEDATVPAATTSSRPPPSFTPRQPRLSNPSVSNATASYQPSMSPDASAKRSNGSEASASEVEELGRSSRQSSAISFPGGDVTPHGTRSRQLRHTATLRGGNDQRVVDTLTSQLESLGKSTISVSPTKGARTMADLLHSANTIEARNETGDGTGPLPSQAGVTKSPKPPRPPRHAHRPSDENLSPAAGAQSFSRDVTSGDDRTPATSFGVQSLGRSASRRITRLLGQQADE